MSVRVSVTIVTWNSARFIGRCLETLAGQTHRDLEVIVIDNGSVDHTPKLLRQSVVPSHVTFNPHNRGFAAAQNQAVAEATGDIVLALNPDTLLTPSFIEAALTGFAAVPRGGMVAPKLRRPTAAFEIPRDEPVIDSSGMYLTASLRHFDRGAGDRDVGQYDRPERVFGPSGAAAFYSRALIEDVAIDGQFFDERFFAYREDADLAWRARLLGWECVYIPQALGYHLRRVRPDQRRHLPVSIKRHSVKNRFLMRIKNITPDFYARVAGPATLRDLAVLGAVLTVEPQSLPAFVALARSLPSALRDRRAIQRRRRPTMAPLWHWTRCRAMPLPAAAPEADLTTVPATAPRATRHRLGG
jgi:GT2 family glycosyltransferase